MKTKTKTKKKQKLVEKFDKTQAAFIWGFQAGHSTPAEETDLLTVMQNAWAAFVPEAENVVRMDYLTNKEQHKTVD